MHINTLLSLCLLWGGVQALKNYSCSDACPNIHWRYDSESERCLVTSNEKMHFWSGVLFCYGLNSSLIKGNDVLKTLRRFSMTSTVWYGAHSWQTGSKLRYIDNYGLGKDTKIQTTTKVEEGRCAKYSNSRQMSMTECGAYKKENFLFAVCETKAKSKCFCEKGFKFKDGKCVDIDECAQNNGDCEDTCTNTKGSYTCSCTAGKSFGLMCHVDGIGAMDYIKMLVIVTCPVIAIAIYSRHKAKQKEEGDQEEGIPKDQQSMTIDPGVGLEAVDQNAQGGEEQNELQNEQDEGDGEKADEENADG